MSKNKVKFNKLPADKRPLFLGITNKVHRTKIDKANSRQSKKEELRKELNKED